MRPRLLDLFCGAGGAAMGYHRAGFDVVGVDIVPQPNYPFRFAQADALDWLHDVLLCQRTGLKDEQGFPMAEIDAIHASPPCQAFTAYQRTGNVGDYPDLVDGTRQFLDAAGLPYVIENVVGAPLIDPVLICGTMLDPPLEIQRHRLFETNWVLPVPQWPCRHLLNGRDRYPGGRSVERTGTSTGLVRATVEVGSWDIPLATQQEAMGIDWMTLEELSEAIPPAYTEHIGSRLLAHLKVGGVTLAEIAVELRLLAGELRGHDDLDQWIRLEALADEIDKERNFITKRCNALAKRVLTVETERNEAWAALERTNTSFLATERERDRLLEEPA